MKYLRLTKEWLDRMLLSFPYVNMRYVAHKMEKSEQLPYSHGWFPIERRAVEKAIADYAQNGSEHDALVLDIVYCHQRYLTSPEEYFHFAFDRVNTTHALRKEFLAEDMMNLIMIDEVGIECCDELEDKYGMYTKLKPYYKRDVCKVENEEDYESYVQFVEKHDSYFVKPNSSSCGRGCYRVDPFTHTHTHTHTHGAYVADFQQLIEGKGSVLEELIEQDERMKQWNHTSVQTIRLNTILNKKGFYVLPAALRIGRENAVVDNAASGGYV